jgi:DNA-binding transcriptional LysR family regulator
MDKLQAMNTFVRIADHGSLTAAAEALDKSLPSVVRTLAMLEESLQVRLFNRTTRRIALTEEGRIYLEQCRKILSDIHEAEQTLGRQQTEPSGKIYLTAPVRFGEMHVAGAVSRFLERYPKTQINLLLLDRMVDIIEEGIDVAVRIAHLPDSSLVARSIASIRQVVCASPKLLERHPAPQHPKQLSGLPCVHFSGISSSHEWDFVEPDGKTLSIPVRSLLSCNQIGASVEACRAGVGFGRFYSYQVSSHIKSGDLKVLLTEFEPVSIPLSLVFPHSRLLSARVRALIEWLLDDFRRTLAKI